MLLAQAGGGDQAQWLGQGLLFADSLTQAELPSAAFPFRMRKQYSPGQMLAAVADVEGGKSVSSAARDHGIPLRSLYRKLKSRSSAPDDD